MWVKTVIGFINPHKLIEQYSYAKNFSELQIPNSSDQFQIAEKMKYFWWMIVFISLLINVIL